MMGSDIDHDSWDCEIHQAGMLAMRKRAAELRAQLCASRGLTPSQACQVGCSICGVIDASPARCEQCTPPLGRPFTGAAPGMLQDDDRGLSRWLASTPEAMRCARDAAAMAGTHRPAPRYDHQAAGVCPEAHTVCQRTQCRCGSDGCSDSSCPGRSA